MGEFFSNNVEEHFTNYNQIQQNNQNILIHVDDYQQPKTEEPKLKSQN